MRGHRDLAFVVRIALIAALLGLVIPVEWLSLLVSAPLFFVLPGYALASVAFARRPRDLAPLIALTLGLSLATLALGSLLLNLLPGGLRAGWWGAFLVLVTLAACRQAALRRDPGYRRLALPSIDQSRPATGPAGLVAAGVVLGAAAIALAFVTLKAPDAVGFTELWIRPLPSSASVQIGVGSQEQKRTIYRLEVRSSGSAPFATRRLFLDPAETEVLRIPLPDQPATRTKRVVAILYTAAAPGRPYRRVNAWVGGRGG